MCVLGGGGGKSIFTKAFISQWICRVNAELGSKIPFIV